MEGVSISVPLTPVSLKIDSEVEREGHPDSMGFPIKSSYFAYEIVNSEICTFICSEHITPHH
jgi:hypothetical protein